MLELTEEVRVPVIGPYMHVDQIRAALAHYHPLPVRMVGGFLFNKSCVKMHS